MRKMCDCSSISSFMQAQTESKIQTAVARKVLDSQADQGEAMVKMLSSAEAVAKANAEVAAGPMQSAVDVYA